MKVTSIKLLERNTKLGLNVLFFLLSNCKDDNSLSTTIDEPSAERLAQLAYRYGNWEVVYNNIVYQNNIATDTFKRYFYLDFQPDGSANQTSIDQGFNEDFLLEFITRCDTNGYLY